MRSEEVLISTGWQKILFHEALAKATCQLLRGRHWIHLHIISFSLAFTGHINPIIHPQPKPLLDILFLIPRRRQAWCRA